MELKQLMSVLKHWSWLVVLGLIVGAASGYVLSKTLTPTYQGKTKILVARTQQQKDSDTIYSNEQQYVDTYIELIKTDPVLNAASSKLGFKIDDTKVLVQQIRTTQLVEVIVEDSNPERAANIANTLVVALLEQKEALDSSRYNSDEAVLETQVSQAESQMASLQTKLEQAQTADVQDQLNQVNTQIASLQEQITALQTEIGNLNVVVSRVQQSELAQKQSQLSQIQSILYMYEQIRANLLIAGRPADSGGSQKPQLLQLQATLNLYQQLYLSLLNNLESLRMMNLQNAPTISQVEKAIPAQEPIRPLPTIFTMLAGMIGLILTAGTAFLIEYLDDTIKSAEEVERVLDVPVIGSIHKTHHINEPGDIYSVSNPNTPTAEAFRRLRTSFNFAKSGKPFKTIAVLSPNEGDGKTTIAVNLAALFAQGGKHVTLVEANLRQPNLHQTLNLENQTGFSELLEGTTDVQGVNYSLGDGQGFDIIPGGSLPVNLAELLEADHLEHAITKIKKNSNIVIFDGPPLIFAEAQLLAAKVDAVLLVVRPGTISAETARTMAGQLNRVGVHIVGVALNRANHRKIFGARRRTPPRLVVTTKRLIPLMKKIWKPKTALDIQR